MRQPESAADSLSAAAPSRPATPGRGAESRELGHQPPGAWPQHRLRFVVYLVAPAAITTVFFFGVIFTFIIPTMKSRIVERKKETLRALTQGAWSQLAALQAQEAAGELTRASAQDAAVARVRDLRYGDDGKGSFWLCDLQPRMIVDPSRPDLNGKEVSTVTDSTGRRPFLEFARVVKDKGDGYVESVWMPREAGQPPAPTLVYVKGFAPWGWMVGTGAYLEDVQFEVRRMVSRVVGVSLVICLVLAAFLTFLAREGLSLERHRRRAENALRESEEKYRSLVEGTSAGVLLVLQDRPVYANQALLARLACSQQDLIHLPLDRIIEPAPGVAPAAPHQEHRARLKTANGEVSDVLLSSAPVKIGEKTGQMLSIREIAGRKTSEETLARLLADLQCMLPLATRSIKSSPLPLVTCALGTPIQEAVMAMARARFSAILVMSPAGEPVGIVTDHDIRDRVLGTGRALSDPVASIMSAPLVRITDRAMLFEAARLMQQRNVRHLVVTDERGATLGILTATEVLHTQQHAIGTLLREIENAAAPEALRDSRGRLPVFVKALLDSGARVETVTRIMTAVSDAILRRLIVLAEAELGPPPSTYAFVVLGSEARQEQTLATDQDNAIIFADVDPAQNGAAQDYFLRLGEKVCSGLDLAGYRRCQGEVMACNPKWCQPLSRWREYFTSCVTSPGLDQVLDLNILFDFRCGHGAAGHVAQVREHLLRLLAAEPRHAFFFHLARGTLEYRPPRGFFGNIQLETGAEHSAAFNIKAAIIPLVNFARIYALRNGFAETNTLERLRRLRDEGLLLPSSHDELAQSFTTLMEMRLTHQARLASRGLPPDNHIDLHELTQIERSVLKKIFADITVFQARLRTDFARTA